VFLGYIGHYGCHVVEEGSGRRKGRVVRGGRRGRRGKTRKKMGRK